MNQNEEIKENNIEKESEKKAAEREQKKNSVKQSIKNSFTTRKFKGGAYAAVLSAIAVALVLVVNMIATRLDIKLDLTSDKKFSLSEETITLLKGLKDDITIYYLVSSGNEITYFDRLFDKYDDYGSKVKLAYKDPILYPKFASGYVEEEVTEQSFLVVNETTGRARYVSNADILIKQLNYSTFQYETTGIDLEGKLDAAIQYVTNENLPVMYVAAGHGEAGVSSVMAELLEKNNVTVKEIIVITLDSIPKDCNILFLYQPQNDYTKEEVERIENYLMDGGYAIICVDYITPELENFNSLLSFYGIEVQEGIIFEGDSNYYIRQPFMLLPAVLSSSITESVRGKKYVAAAYASGMTLREDIRGTITAAGLLSTSEDAYTKQLDSENIAKEDGDLEGPFYLGIELHESLAGEETKIAVFSAKAFFEDSILSASSYGNADILINTINTFTEQENAASVPVMNLAVDTVSLTAGQANRIAVIVAVLLPLAIIGTGIFVVVRRRKK